jgi:Ran GTPase-activating protein (RanGAP) involved in mRNA processing and transport
MSVPPRLHRWRPCFDQNTALRNLVLDGAVINGEVLARGLQHNATLERLHLNDCVMRDGGVNALVNALIANPNSALTHIGLCSVGMTNVGLISLMRLVHTSSTVDVLHVSGNQITDAGWAAVAATLRITSTLRVLRVADGPLVSSGTSRLALQEAVRVNASVEMSLAEIALFQPMPIPTVVERESARAALLASGMRCVPRRLLR